MIHEENEEYSEKIKFVSIYKNDLKNIYDILRRNNYEVNITALKKGRSKKDKLDTIDDVEEYALNDVKYLNNITFTVKNIENGFSIYPKIEVEFNSTTGVNLFINNKADSTLYGITQEIKQIIEQRKNRIFVILDNGFFQGALGLLVLFVSLIIIITNDIKNNRYDKDSFANVFASTGMSAFVFMILYKITKNKSCIIYTKNKSELPNFFIRNRDKIILDLLKWGGGFILGFFSNRFLQ